MVLLNCQLHWSVHELGCRIGIHFRRVWFELYTHILLGCRVVPSNAKSCLRHCLRRFATKSRQQYATLSSYGCSNTTAKDSSSLFCYRLNRPEVLKVVQLIRWN